MFELLKNNRNIYFKKYIFEILKENFNKNEKIVDRILYSLTDDDLKDFSSLIGDVYSAAYLKCVEDHKNSLEKIGYKVSVSKDSTK